MSLPAGAAKAMCPRPSRALSEFVTRFRSGSQGSSGLRSARPRRWVLLLVMGLLACDSPDPMNKQARYEPYRESHFFADGRMMRTPPEDTVSQEQPRGGGPRLTGRDDAGLRRRGPDPAHPGAARARSHPLRDGVRRLPRAARRWREPGGAQHGAAAAAADRGPAGLRDLQAALERARARRPTEALSTLRAQHDLPHALGFYFSAITEGYGLMPSYADMLPPDDRWAVVAYLQALSRSQRVEAASLSAAERRILEGGER